MAKKASLPQKFFNRYRKPLVDLPNLVESQLESFKRLVEEEAAHVFEEFSPITDHSGKKFELSLSKFEFGSPKWDEHFAKRTMKSYEGGCPEGIQDQALPHQSVKTESRCENERDPRQLTRENRKDQHAERCSTHCDPLLPRKPFAQNTRSERDIDERSDEEDTLLLKVFQSAEERKPGCEALAF
jgi:hypothetical protein